MARRRWYYAPLSPMLPGSAITASASCSGSPGRRCRERRSPRSRAGSSGCAARPCRRPDAAERAGSASRAESYVPTDGEPRRSGTNPLLAWRWAPSRPGSAIGYGHGLTGRRRARILRPAARPRPSGESRIRVLGARDCPPSKLRCRGCVAWTPSWQTDPDRMYPHAKVLPRLPTRMLV